MLCKGVACAISICRTIYHGSLAILPSTSPYGVTLVWRELGLPHFLVPRHYITNSFERNSLAAFRIYTSFKIKLISGSSGSK